jgi:subtilase family serine protease
VKTSKTGFLMLVLVLGMLSSAMAQIAAVETQAHDALPYPDAATPKGIDLGALKVQSGTTPISVTIALRLPQLNEAENLLKSLNTPGDPQFHQFLTADQFVARFAPANADVAKVITGLAKYGLAAERTSATTLKVTGLPADMERAFAVSLHSYEVPAHGNASGYNFHAPLSRPTIPAEISASVVAVVGLDSRPSLRPRHDVAPQTVAKARATEPSKMKGNPFGYLTVTDFANHYDVQPLYSRGVSGSGRTLAIVTLASFTPSDAFAYWSALGLTVNPSRIAVVNIDGGPGAPSDASGSLETTLDVEQSGGIAPGANIIVYQAPNTNQGFLDDFAAAIDANSAETISTSWGFWEWFNNLENAPVIDPITGLTVGSAQATHELLVRAAIQGQTVFAASGDGGAYDLNNDLGCLGPYSSTQPYSCSLTLSVDYPASDPAITAAGGTTLPGIQEYCVNATCTPPYVINIPHERVWGWDYLNGLCTALGYTDPISCGTFPGGGGGGVSIIFEKPWYQFFLPGIQRSQPGQIYEAGEGIVSAVGVVGTYYALPAYYAGRNVPDVSFNADPETGYVIYYTSEPSGVFGLQTFYGGTSFVAPQLNGVSALLGEYLHGSRIGLLNFPLYGLALSGEAYKNPGAPLHAIKDGDNWFYHGRNGYSPAAGLGTLDVANFAEALRGQF